MCEQLSGCGRVSFDGSRRLALNWICHSDRRDGYVSFVSGQLVCRVLGEFFFLGAATMAE